MNSLLLLLEEVGVKVIAYADDILQRGLNITERWACINGLWVNLTKAELVLLNSKHKKLL